MPTHAARVQQKFCNQNSSCLHKFLSRIRWYVQNETCTWARLHVVYEDSTSCILIRISRCLLAASTRIPVEDDNSYMQLFQVTHLWQLLVVAQLLVDNNNKKYDSVRDVDFGDILGADVRQSHPITTYNLLANIVHDGEPGKGTYRVHVLHKVINSNDLSRQYIHVINVRNWIFRLKRLAKLVPRSN